MAAIGVMIAVVCKDGRRKHMFTHRGSGVRENACIHCGVPNEQKGPLVRHVAAGALLEQAQRAVKKLTPPAQFRCLHCKTKVDERTKASHASRCGGTEFDFELVVPHLTVVP